MHIVNDLCCVAMAWAQLINLHIDLTVFTITAFFQTVRPCKIIGLINYTGQIDWLALSGSQQFMSNASFYVTSLVCAPACMRR